jgi:glycosyltransferase involved in cell wall biosynthesis
LGGNMRIAVVIPARNEEGSVGGVVSRIHGLHPAVDIVVIDDASGDATARLARRAGAKVLKAPLKLGYGGAVQTGLKYAYAGGYDLVVLMDADGQHDPDYIGALIAGARDYDMTIGSRFTGQAYEIPAVRLVGMKVFSTIATLITGRRITDTSSGFQALRRDVVRLFALGSYPVDFPDADTVIWVARHGFSVGEVPVRMHARAAGRSMISGVTSSLRYALKMPLSILVTLLRIPASRKGGDFT